MKDSNVLAKEKPRIIQSIPFSQIYYKYMATSNLTPSNIDISFVKEFESEVLIAYQRMGSKLLPTVRNKTNVIGSSTTFQKLGEGQAKSKSRNGDVPIMSNQHSSVECQLQDFYAGSWLDALDELKIEHDERQALATSGAYALGRKTDELITDAMYKVVEKYNSGSSAEKSMLRDHKIDAYSSGLKKENILKAFEVLGNKDVPDDGQRYCVVSWKQFSDLLNIEEFANADYIGGDSQPWQTGQAKNWLGTIWIPHTGLPVKNGRRYCFWYHKSAIAHASGKEITTDISWHGFKASYFINSMMSQGAALIEPQGCVVFETKP